MVKIKPDLKQEKHGQELIQHMPMPVRPGSKLIINHTQFGSVLLKALLNRLARRKLADHILKGDITTSIAEVKI